jgi:hypothetical protein
LFYKNKLVNLHRDDGDAETDDSESGPSTSKATEKCKIIACLQLVTVMMNYVNTSNCDYVNTDGVTKTI